MSAGRIPMLVAAISALAVAHAHAQPVPVTISCADHDGRTVTNVQVTNGVMARATIDAAGRPVIEYDPRRVADVSPQIQLFVYAHECGHHALGHDLHGQPISPAQEHDADCYGTRVLMDRAGVTVDDVRRLQQDLQALGAGDARRLPWSRRTYDLVACLPRAPADDTATAVNPIDACVLHQDAANAVISKTRDGRTITGTYSAANHCDRAVVCTFTIEIGTVPDTDADAGSFARFHLQKARTEQHRLMAGEGAEYRFQETVDAVPAGESTDFRVRVACEPVER
jgi:hypothetical protein